MNGSIPSREQAQALLQRLMGFSKAERVQVNVNSSVTANTRFAANQLSTSGSVQDTSVAIQSWFGARHAVTTTNDLSDASLRHAVESSEALAKLAPEDPEDMPLLGPQTYTPVQAFFDSTTNLSPADRAQAAISALGVTRASSDLQAAGFIVTGGSAFALANSAGLFAYHRTTSANYTLTVRTSDGTGSGWAGADHPDWNQLDFKAVSERAIQKARASRNPVAIEPGRYTVILEPQAVGDLVQLLLFYADARSADEGRSPFVKESGGNKIGEKILDQRVSMISDPQNPQLLSQPFDGQGLPLNRREWIKDGVLQQLSYSRFWAKKQGKEPTGGPGSVIMPGGPASLDSMI
ncbi:MAG: TldD/PmbA family protein, partial [Gemmatimonadota bacterium]